MSLTLLGCPEHGAVSGECSRTFDNACGHGCTCPASLRCEVAAGSSGLRACVTPCVRSDDCPSGQLCSAPAGETAGQCWPACGMAADCPTWGECQTQRGLPGGDVAVCRLRTD